MAQFDHTDKDSRDNDDRSLVRGWVRKADGDLASLIVLSEKGLNDTACFHAQQAVEKYLKALLAFSEAPIPHTHNLEELHKLCLKLFPAMVVEARLLSDLSPYAVQIRYDFQFWPESSAVQEAQRTVHLVRELVLSQIPKTVFPDE